MPRPLDRLDEAIGHVGVERAHELVAALDAGSRGRRGARTPRPSRARCSRRRPPRPRSQRAVRTRSSSADASSSVCTPWTPGPSMPGRSGRTGRAPVATRSWSNSRWNVRCAGVVADLDLARGSRSMRHHLVVQAHVDALLAVLLRGAGDEVVERRPPHRRRGTGCRRRSSSSTTPARGPRSRGTAAAGGPAMAAAMPAGVAAHHDQPLHHAQGGYRPGAWEDRAVAVREDCRHYSTRTTRSGRGRAALPRRHGRGHAVRLPGALPLLRAPVDHRRRLAALRPPRRRPDRDLAARSRIELAPAAQEHVGLGRAPRAGRAPARPGRGRRTRPARGRRRRRGRAARACVVAVHRGHAGGGEHARGVHDRSAHERQRVGALLARRPRPAAPGAAAPRRRPPPRPRRGRPPAARAAARRRATRPSARPRTRCTHAGSATSTAATRSSA